MKPPTLNRQQKVSTSVSPAGAPATLSPLTLGMVAVALAATVVAIYSPALDFKFILDDHRYVGDPRIQSPGHLWEYFTTYVWAQFTGGPSSFYRPLFALWMRLNFILSGESAWGWHLLCILKHVSVAVLLGLLVWKLLRDQIAALLAGTLFALHPGPNRIRSVGERTRSADVHLHPRGIGAGGTCGANPFDLMELIRRTPHGSFFTYQTTFRLTHPLAAICIALGQHTRAGIEDNLWNTTKGVRMTTLQMIERHVRMAEELGRPIATAEQAHQMLKIGVTYSSTAETLANLGLPPNRRPGNMGFMVHETDGRFQPAAQGGCGHIHAGDWEGKVDKVELPGKLKVA